MSTWSERAEKFKQDWKDHGQSKEDALSFWHGFLGDVLKIDNPMSYIKLKSVEEANFSRFVTLSIPSTNVEIRHVLSKLGETISFKDTNDLGASDRLDEGNAILIAKNNTNL